MKYVSSQQNGGSKLIASNANFSPFSPRSIFLIFYSKGLGKDPATKSDEFLEKLQTAFDPPPHFWKIMLQIFYNGYGRIYARSHRPDSIS